MSLTVKQSEIISNITNYFIEENKVNLTPVIDVNEIIDFVNRKNQFIKDCNSIKDTYEKIMLEMINNDLIFIEKNLSPLGFKVKHEIWGIVKYIIIELANFGVNFKYIYKESYNKEFNYWYVSGVEIVHNENHFTNISDALKFISDKIKNIYVGVNTILK